MKAAVLLAALALAGCDQPQTRLTIQPDFVGAMKACADDGRGAVLTGGYPVERSAVYARGDTALYCEALP